MGFWSSACRGVGFIVTLGGSERLRRAKDQYESARLTYETILAGAKRRSTKLAKALRALGKHTEIAFKHLQVAQRILEPLNKYAGKGKVTVAINGKKITSTPTLSIACEIRRFTEIKAAAQGAVAGTALGVGSWTAVSALGSASTGIAIATLHGAAATNATLAWFGGGSLAAGGWGMGGGTFFLGGITLIPIIGVSAWQTHSAANEINRATREVKDVTNKNRHAIQKLDDRISKVARLIPQFSARVEHLSADIKRIQRALFPFGLLSRLRKRIRFWFGGFYYNQAEMSLVEELAGLADQFVTGFARQNKLLAP